MYATSSHIQIGKQRVLNYNILLMIYYKMITSHLNRFNPGQTQEMRNILISFYEEWKI